MAKLLLAVSVVASVLVAPGARSVAQILPPELPLALICWNQQAKTWMVGYLHTVMEDGTATYRGEQTATLNAQRVLEAPSDGRAALDCHGKTLDELRALDRVIERPRAQFFPDSR